jgi:integrase
VGRKQRWETIGSNKKEAERILGQRVAEISQGLYFKPQDITFKSFADKWLVNGPQARVKPSTLRNYQSDLKRHLIPAFGDYYLTHMTQERLEGFFAKLIKTRSAKTVNNIRLTLHIIMSYALRLKYIPYNPVSDIPPFKVEYKEMDFFNPDEIRLLLEHSREPYKTIFLTAVMTGMRRGEVLGLQWGDIDWNANIIFIRRSIYWSTWEKVGESSLRWQFVSPKSKRSIRSIVMSPRLKEVLEVHRITSSVSAYDLVFCNSAGEPLEPDNMVKREFLTALSFAGLRRIRFHDLRHSYTSLLIAQGENVKFIQSQLGHASIQTTMDRYGHLLPGSPHSVGLKLDSQVFTRELQEVVVGL